jgi:hypothetical protein
MFDRSPQSPPRLVCLVHSWTWFLCIALFCLATPAQAEDDPPPQGILRVTADQTGASVYVGVRLMGETPLTSSVNEGTHTVRVLKDGFEPFVRRITIKKDQTTAVKASLFAGKGSVEFVVDPPGATLAIEGGEKWPTPVRLKDLKPGKYEYTLSAPGHEPDSGSFDFVPGKNLLISTALMSSEGMVSITSNPSGAIVVLNGHEAGLTPLHLEDVGSGKHTAQLILRGRATVFRRFDTSDGSKGDLEVRMPKRGVPLSIATGNKEAELDIEGMTLGPRSAYRFGPVERGRYEIHITAPGKKPIEQNIQVPVSGTALYRARLRPREGQAASTLHKNPPFYQHWLFWSGVSAGVAGVTTGVILSFQKPTTTPAPSGDLLVNLP